MNQVEQSNYDYNRLMVAAAMRKVARVSWERIFGSKQLDKLVSERDRARELAAKLEEELAHRDSLESIVRADDGTVLAVIRDRRA